MAPAKTQPRVFDEARDDAAEPARPSRRRRRRSRRLRSQRERRSRVRLAYFTLASLWGFLIGTATVLFGLSLSGRALEWSPVAIVAMASAVILAVVGGVIASRAYREASRRR